VGSDLAIALLIAALFQPVRLRLAQFFTHRFRPRAFDPSSALATFGDGVRTDPNPVAAIEQLLDVLDTTLHPKYASLWLPEGKRPGGFTTWSLDARVPMDGDSADPRAKSAEPGSTGTHRSSENGTPVHHDISILARSRGTSRGRTWFVGAIVVVYLFALLGTWLANLSIGDAGIFRGARWQDGNGNLVVVDVASGSPANRAGIRPGDAIMAIDGQPISDATMLAWASRKPGDVTTFLVHPGANRYGNVDRRDFEIVLQLASRLTMPLFVVSLLLYTLLGGFAVGVATLAALARPRDKAALDFLIGMACYAAALLLDLWGNQLYVNWITRAFFYVFVFGTSALLRLFLTFPVEDGLLRRARRSGPAWLRPLGGVSVLMFLLPLAIITVLVQGPVIHAHAAFVVIIFMLGRMVFGLFRAYRIAASEVARAQLRWIITGLSLGVVGLGLGPESGINVFNPQVWPIVFTVGAWIFFPISVTVAIFRYHLWDIEILVRRSLIYTVLTAALAAIYLIEVAVLGSLSRSLTGTDSNVTLIASTLVIALLFDPLRQRVQTVIDRRFCRRRYNVDHALERFTSAVRDEVELSSLLGRMLDVIQDTLQPADLSLWLNQPAPVAGHPVSAIGARSERG
jgi:hypothetical protein